MSHAFRFRKLSRTLVLAVVICCLTFGAAWASIDSVSPVVVSETGHAPDVSGDLAVWATGMVSDDTTSDIVGFDFATGSQFEVSVDAGMQFWPKVDGRRVAWTNVDDGGIWVHDLDAGVSTRVAVPDFVVPCVLSGDWLAWADSEAVYLRNLATDESRTLPVAQLPMDLDIEGKWVVWLEPSGSGTEEIKSYHLVTDTVETVAHFSSFEAGENLSQPQVSVSSNRVLYGASSASSLVVALDLLTGQRIEIPVEDSPSYVNASGDIVVWGESGNVYAADLASRIPVGVAVSPVGEYFPRVSGTRVVWTIYPEGVYSADVAGAFPSAVLPVEVAGEGRFDTAVRASRAAFPDGLDPDGAETVVIATGRNWPDALGGSALAGALDAPILLVSTNSVPDVVLAEVSRLKATKAVIVGGEVAVGPEVASALASAGLIVERVAGGNRYATADAVALRVIDELGDDYDGTAFVATGGAYADAVAAGPLAASQGWPLYLAHPTSGLGAPTLAAMADVTDALVLGGEAAVSSQAHTTLVARLGEGGVTRLAGGSRYETAVEIAKHAVANTDLVWNRVGIATGQAYPDALAGGVLQGKMGSVMLLTRGTALSSEPAAALEANKDAISTVTFFGGDAAVAPAVRAAVAQALQ